MSIPLLCPTDGRLHTKEGERIRSNGQLALKVNWTLDSGHDTADFTD